MANSLYTRGRQDFLEAGTSWLTSTIRGALLSSAYTPNISGNQFLSDIPFNVIVASSIPLTSKTSGSGIANAANITFTAVTGVNTIPYLLLFKDTSVLQTSSLIVHIDTASGLPVTSNGGDIGVNWDTGVNKIFLL